MSFSASPHILAIFGAEVARAPSGLEREPSLPHTRFPEPEQLSLHDAECQSMLQEVYERSTSAARALKMLGKGCGFSFEASPYVSYANKNGVHVMLAGEVSKWPGVDAVSTSHNAFVRNEEPLEANDASWLLDFYSTFTEPGVEEDLELQSPGGTTLRKRGAAPAVLLKALECLAELEGSFSFVIFDALRHRVLAARDREGVSPLFWGVTETGQLLIGSSLADMMATNPTATAFPAGCLFTSEHMMLAYSAGPLGWMIPAEDTPGELTSFVEAEDHAHFKSVKTIPRITSKGVVCGSVYKVASTADMSAPCHAV